MVFGLGFLGDMVHLLPALWMVRQAYPRAELHVGVAAHVASFLECIPWAEQVWSYPRFPRHATLGENLDFVRRLRRERFDVLINLNTSDRSGWLTFFSGARERLGLTRKDGGPGSGGKVLTELVEPPASEEPVYLQNCLCWKRPGSPLTGWNSMSKSSRRICRRRAFPQPTPGRTSISAHSPPTTARS